MPGANAGCGPIQARQSRGLSAIRRIFLAAVEGEFSGGLSVSRKLIFVNRYAHPDHSATSQMVSDLAFRLGATGCDVVLIASRQCYDNPGAALPAREAIGGVAIRRVWTSRFGRGWLLGRAFDYLSFYLTAAVAVLRTARRGDIVVVKTDPPMLSVVIGPLARMRGAAVVNWLQDVFPEVAVALGVSGFGGAFGKVARGLRNVSLRRAAMNVAIGVRMSVLVRTQGVPRDQIAVIPNWADDAIHPLAHADNPLRGEWALAGKFVVAYSGNLGRAHEFQTILDAAEQLRAEPDIIFLFIGGGYQRGALEAQARARGLANVRSVGYQPSEFLSQSLGVADVHWISLRPELEGLIVPSKIYGVMAAGRPALMVGDPDGEIGRLLRLHECGMTVPVGAGVALAEAILRLRDAADLREAMGHRARSAYEENFTPAHGFGKWQRLLARVQ
jgi:colanic acid biosynthesis glycosyl transferase WcaI